MAFQARIRITNAGTEIGMGNDTRIAFVKGKVLRDERGVSDGQIQIIVTDESLLKSMKAGDEFKLTLTEIK